MTGEWEVSTEYDPEWRARGVCVVYINGHEVSAHPTFDAAMRSAFPMWEPQRDYLARYEP